MYRISTCPIPNQMRADLDKAAAYDIGRIRIATVWAFKSITVVGITCAALYAAGQGIDYLVPDSVDLRRCTLSTPMNLFAVLPWILGTVGFGAIGFSQLHWRLMQERARLARLDLDAGECERIEVDIPAQHIVVGDDDFSMLLLPDGASRTIVLNIFHNGDDRRVEKLFDKETCRAICSWKRSKHSQGMWDVQTAGAPLQLQDPVVYGSTRLDEVLTDLSDGDTVLDVPFERLLDLSREKPRKKAKLSNDAEVTSSVRASRKHAPAQVV